MRGQSRILLRHVAYPALLVTLVATAIAALHLRWDLGRVSQLFLVGTIAYGDRHRAAQGALPARHGEPGRPAHPLHRARRLHHRHPRRGGNRADRARRRHRPARPAPPPRPAAGRHGDPRAGRPPPARAGLLRELAALGYHYGPAFQGIDEVWIGPDEALAKVRPTAAIAARARTTMCTRWCWTPSSRPC